MGRHVISRGWLTLACALTLALGCQVDTDDGDGTGGEGGSGAGGATADGGVGGGSAVGGSGGAAGGTGGDPGPGGAGGDPGPGGAGGDPGPGGAGGDPGPGGAGGDPGPGGAGGAGGAPGGCDAPDPSAGGCATDDDCNADHVCRPAGPGDCRPSACQCDAPSGQWVCTADCGGNVCVPDDVCAGPSPQGCREIGCPEGQRCSLDPEDGCSPSSCGCDPDDGWFCTDDCNGGTCVPDGPNACEGPNPQGCRETGCPEGQRCSMDIEDGCAPSGCACDEESGSWGCTADCNGGVCVPDEPVACPGPNPQGCANTGCPEGEVCELIANACVPSSCECDAESGAWICTEDCGGGICVAGPRVCEGPNPQGCRDTGCPEGQMCQLDLPGACIPSACECDPDTGIWACTEDCGGGACVDDEPPGCIGPNPGGCRNQGCPDGLRCSLDLEDGCAPSSCGCDEETGMWLCTADCGGGVCVEDEGDACDGPSPAGCRMNGCPDGQRCSMDIEDGCAPSSCQCMNGFWACTRDCGGGVCVAGDEPGRNQWYLTCGDPVCRGHQADPNVPPCEGELAGNPCNAPGRMCDPIDECNARLVCTDEDPRAGPCPISKAAHKQGIRPLTRAEVDRIAEAVQAVPLSSWAYRPGSGDAGEHVGFVIEDLPADLREAATRPGGDRVDLYGYTSLAVATLQSQARQIDALEAKLAELEARLERAAAMCRGE